MATYYPDADPESTSVDGYVLNDDSNNTYSTRAEAMTACRNTGSTSPGATPDDSSATAKVGAYLNTSSGRTLFYCKLYRAMLVFDTSSIPAGSTIDSASLRINASAALNQDNDGEDLVHAVDTGGMGSNTSISSGDFDVLGSTSFGSFDISSYIGGWMTITLNASGKANVTPAGISYFGLMEGHDFNDSALNSVADGTVENSITFSTADGANPPELIVTYTEPPGIGAQQKLIIIT